jgi:hypothetical protein
MGVDIFSDIKQYGIPSLLEQYGYKIDKSGFAPCPACKASYRHTKRQDPRLACIVVQGGQGWVCLQCGAKGDTVDLVARTLGDGSRPTSPGAWRAVLERWTQGGATRTTPLPSKRQEGASPLARVDFKSLMVFWNGLMPTPNAKERAWLEAKYPTYTLEELTETGCVKFTDKNTSYPEWWPWKYPAMMMLSFDSHGLVQSIHGRICAEIEPGKPKSRFPKGYSASGLVLANKSAVSWLRGKVPCTHVIVAEGLTSTLACTMAMRKIGKWRYGVVGYTSGSHAAIKQMHWQNEEVTIFTDTDKAGDDYAQKIVEALPPTIVVKRASL